MTLRRSDALNTELQIDSWQARPFTSVTYESSKWPRARHESLSG